jgi:hypothetical protein
MYQTGVGDGEECGRGPDFPRGLEAFTAGQEALFPDQGLGPKDEVEVEEHEWRGGERKRQSPE